MIGYTRMPLNQNCTVHIMASNPTEAQHLIHLSQRILSACARAADVKMNSRNSCTNTADKRLSRSKLETMAQLALQEQTNCVLVHNSTRRRLPICMATPAKTLPSKCGYSGLSPSASGLPLSQILQFRLPGPKHLTTWVSNVLAIC